LSKAITFKRSRSWASQSVAASVARNSPGHSRCEFFRFSRRAGSQRGQRRKSARRCSRDAGQKIGRRIRNALIDKGLGHRQAGADAASSAASRRRNAPIACLQLQLQQIAQHAGWPAPAAASRSGHSSAASEHLGVDVAAMAWRSGLDLVAAGRKGAV